MTTELLNELREFEQSQRRVKVSENYLKFKLGATANGGLVAIIIMALFGFLMIGAIALFSFDEAIKMFMPPLVFGMGIFIVFKSLTISEIDFNNLSVIEKIFGFKTKEIQI